MRPPIPNGSRLPMAKPKLKNPESFNESMYQRSQAWLLQKEQRVMSQKRESALREQSECTFSPNSQLPSR